MGIDKLPEWMMYFYIYCFVGWIWECCYVSAAKRKLVNRGFLKGPLLPIYGSGAVCILWVTMPVRDNYFLMAVIGMVAATVLEYVTGAAMEALFKVRYWDYSNNFMNLNGHICLKSTICWGVMTFLVVYLVHPPIAALVGQIRPNVLNTVDFAITALAAADFATSFKAAMDFRDVLIRAEQMKEELKNIQQRLDELEKELAESVAETSARRREEMLEAVGKKTEAFRERAAETREAMQERAAETREAIQERAAETREAIQERAVETKETLQAEFQELMLRKRMQTENLRVQYSKSIHGLLKRNPGAVSRKYSEALEDTRAVIREHIERARKSGKTGK